MHNCHTRFVSILGQRFIKQDQCKIGTENPVINEVEEKVTVILCYDIL